MILPIDLSRRPRNPKNLSYRALIVTAIRKYS